MEPSAEDELVLSLTIEHLKEVGSWPKLEDLHQRIHQELGLKVDVKETARRLDPQPYVGGGWSNLGETFAPDLGLINRLSEGQRLIRHIVDLVMLAHNKYQRSRGQPEVTSAEFEDLCGVDPGTASAVRELVHRVPGVTDGGTSNSDGWSFKVNHEVTRWDGLIDGEGLLARLGQLRVQDEEHMAGLSRAKQAMSRSGTRPTALGTSDSDKEQKLLARIARYLETHPVKTILAVIAIPLGIAAAVVTLIKA